VKTQARRKGIMTALALSCATGGVALAQTARTLPPAAPAGEVRVTDRGPHHRTLSWRVAEPAPGGATRLVERRVVELAAGLHYQGPRGEWLESREVLESYPGGCVSRQGPVKIIFARNLATAGAVDAEAPDGRRLRSHLLGLSYLDRATGQSVLIAEVKDCVGVVDGNVVLYEDAFTALEADVRYSVGRGGYEQDILLRRAPPRPERFGLDPRTTVLQVLTEFLDSPSATLRPEPVTDGAGVTAAGDEVDFGALRLGRGRAFRWDGGTRAGDLPVRKTWRKLGDEGRDFLIEEVPLRDIQDELDRLPPTTGAVPGTGDGAAPRTAQVGTGSTPVRDLGLATTGGQRDWGRGWNASLPTSLPTLPAAPRRVRAQEPDAPGMLLAKVTPPERAFVLDYQANIGTNDFTFQADTTYVVLGRLDLYGTTTFEGSAVIKATNVYGADLWVHGPMVWDTGLYRPVVFTSKDDDSVGQPLPGSTGNPQRQQHVGLVVAQSGTVRGARFLYARTALCPVTASLTAEDVQFVDCGNAIDAWGQPVTVRNGLFSQVNNLVASHIANLTVTGEHWTGDAFNTLVNVAGAYSLSALKLTNCLFTAGTNWVTGQSNPTIHTSAVTWLANSSGIYRTAAGGRYYLAANSPYRDIGETNLSAPTLTLLRDRTTFAPVTYSNVTFTVNTTFSQQVPRSTATRDLGYHYAALDYALGGCHTAADLNLLVTAGTAIGWFRTNSGWQHAGQGLHLGDRTVLTFEGTATAPTWWVRLTTVQEAERTGGFGPGGLTSWAWPSFADAPTVRARFLRCAALANESLHIRDDWGWLRVEARDCEFYSGGLGGYVSRLEFTNCLFQRVSAWVSHGRTDADLTLRNATFIGGEFQINRLLEEEDPPLGQSRISVRDCAFDRTAINTADVMSGNPLFSDYGWNAYRTNTTQTTPTGANNLLVTNFNWQAGPLGNHYLLADSPLVNAGSVSDASQAGLYHHTTQPNQAKEASTRVDVGRHYLAVSGSGQPVDSDGDGLADYLEDANGNGAYDSATDLANWSAADTDGDKVRDDQEVSAGTNPKLAADTDADGLPDDWELWHLGSRAQTGEGDYDGDGVSNAGEYAEGRNPNTTGFAVSFATTYTRDDPPQGTIAVRAGHPASWAVLVDTDPPTLAPGQIPWQPCPTGTVAGSSLSIAPSLGNVEGWHTVWVAMRAAPAGAQVTWNRCALKLDRTPPAITLDLAPGTSVPSTLLQIRGQCAEPLRSLSYDLVNASRSLTAAPGFVTAQRTAANPEGAASNFTT
jgi:hypothetical protein